MVKPFCTGCHVETMSEDDRTHQEMHEEINTDFVSYFVNCIKSYESGIIDTSIMVKNLSAAIVLQFRLMEWDESARSINDSPETYSAIQRLTSLIGIVHFKGMIIKL